MKNIARKDTQNCAKETCSTQEKTKRNRDKERMLTKLMMNDDGRRCCSLAQVARISEVNEPGQRNETKETQTQETKNKLRKDGFCC